jgi:hypothetical protein
MFDIHDRVSHKDYPGTTGSVVEKTMCLVIVLWDLKHAPANVGSSFDLPSRTSRHIPSCLRPE